VDIFRDNSSCAGFEPLFPGPYWSLTGNTFNGRKHNLTAAAQRLISLTDSKLAVCPWHGHRIQTANPEEHRGGTHGIHCTPAGHTLILPLIYLLRVSHNVACAMNHILIPISPGELLDKITILEIKSERIESVEKKSNVNTELGMLNKVWTDATSEDASLKSMRKELKSINESLWVIEDDIREEERNRQFGERFIELARSVYVTNDQRADVKKRINLHLNSDIVEEKSYKDYS